MSEMVEKVATAIQEHTDATSWKACMNAARAAIEAMREPTEGMTSPEGTCSEWVNGAEAAALWRYMIDAALTEKE